MSSEWISYSSSNDSCVQFRHVDGTVQVRHSKDPDGPTLTFSAAEWEAFTRGIRTDDRA